MRQTVKIGLRVLATAVMANGVGGKPLGIAGTGFNATVTDGGGVVLKIDQTKYRVESVFSQPKMTLDGWNQVPRVTPRFTSSTPETMP